MKMISSKNFEADYPEDLVPILLQSHLTMVGFPFESWTILPISRKEENLRGFDASVQFRTFIFYMQFKKPFGFYPSSPSYIVDDRNKANLSIEPYSLYFQLLKNEKFGNWQHNMLWGLRCEGAEVAYVCPLEPTETLYVERMRISPLEALTGWINNSAAFLRRRRRIMFDVSRSLTIEQIPSFREHVSIPPHTYATNEVHNYSFSEEGEELYYHGGEALPNGIKKLNYWLKDVLNRAEGEAFYPGDEESMNLLTKYMRTVEAPQSILKEGESYIQSWANFGDFLYRKFRIKQYAFCKRY